MDIGHPPTTRSVAPSHTRSFCAAYNTDVVNAHQNDSNHKHRRHAIYASETSGLLLIASLLLIVTIIRYWHAIHWSVR